MVSSQPTRKVVKELKAAGFERGSTEGSHSQWRHADGRSISVPDGHRTISPGVYRKIVKKISEGKEQQ